MWGGMSADTTDVLSADTTNVLSADTTDVLSADTTDVLSETTLPQGPFFRLGKHFVWVNIPKVAPRKAVQNAPVKIPNGGICCHDGQSEFGACR